MKTNAIMIRGFYHTAFYNIYNVIRPISLFSELTAQTKAEISLGLDISRAPHVFGIG